MSEGLRKKLKNVRNGREWQLRIWEFLRISRVLRGIWVFVLDFGFWSFIFRLVVVMGKVMNVEGRR